MSAEPVRHIRTHRWEQLRAALERLNDPEARWELGEDARRAALASLADEHLLDLLDSHQRLERILYHPENT